MVSGLFPSWFLRYLCEPGYVSNFDGATMLPLCVGLTLLGLIGSWFAWRRRGLAAGTRGIAWSLLPVSLYMTGLLKLLWDIVKSAVTWVAHLIFSPTVWAGAALFGVSVVLYVVSGVARGRGGEKTGEKAPKSKPASSAGTDRHRARPRLGLRTCHQARQGLKGPAKASKQESSEFDEIEDILKRHGIN